MPTNGDHRVIPFRPRNPSQPGAGGWDRHSSTAQLASRPRASEPDDLKRFENSPDEPGEYRHRMIANAAAGIFAIALTAMGVWLAIAISDLRKSQDCVLYGYKDCGGFPKAQPRATTEPG